MPLPTPQKPPTIARSRDDLGIFSTRSSCGCCNGSFACRLSSRYRCARLGVMSSPRPRRRRRTAPTRYTCESLGGAVRDRRGRPSVCPSDRRAATVGQLTSVRMSTEFSRRHGAPCITRCLVGGGLRTASGFPWRKRARRAVSTSELRRLRGWSARDAASGGRRATLEAIIP